MRGSIFVPKNLIIIEAAKGREVVKDKSIFSIDLQIIVYYARTPKSIYRML